MRKKTAKIPFLSKVVASSPLAAVQLSNGTLFNLTQLDHNGYRYFEFRPPVTVASGQEIQVRDNAVWLKVADVVEVKKGVSYEDRKTVVRERQTPQRSRHRTR